MSKSNINIQSNIYIVKDELRRDQALLRQVRGRKALDYLIKYNIMPGPGSFSLIQRNLYHNDIKCVLADEGDFGFGVIKKDEELIWDCRCEKRECPKFKDCRPDLVSSMQVEEEEQVTVIEVETEPVQNLQEIEENTVIEEIAVTQKEEEESPRIEEAVDFSKLHEENLEIRLISEEELQNYFIDVIEKAKQLKMLYKLNQVDIGKLTGRKNKVLIITKTEEESLEASEYLYMSEIAQYLVDREEHKVADQGIEFIPDLEKRETQQVHVASLQDLSALEEEYVNVIFSFEDIEALEQLPSAYLQKLYSICERTEGIYISLLREHNLETRNNKFKMMDSYIDWNSFNTSEHQELLEYIQQGESISINRMSMEDEQYYICYMDMPIGKVQTSFLDELKKVWEKVYDKKLEDVKLLPMKVEGVLAREVISCIQGNKTWMGIRLQGYVKIESRYN